ncbi:hypothetical protein EGW08_005710 [Elysia chlorotica]|uniref:Methyltransferase type 11 domain-containing protein n=1 Tax=Elysia chlorotica TaxID=188477 RepID=A0A433TYD6_ELYCH|nr:hypothetical protein EGW08_005710 [Elysia chlorotica]
MDTSYFSEYAHLSPGNADKSKMFLGTDLSKSYADSRPVYTAELFKTVVDYCLETRPSLDLAVDMGCGSGASTIGFARYFNKVIGVDISETQIACAPKDIPNCEFKVGHSDKLPFIQSGTADLFCFGTSFHWVPQAETLAEVDRVLRPGGIIAIFGYDVPSSSIQAVQACFQRLWKKVFPFAAKETAQVMERFRGLKMPYPGAIRNDDIKLKLDYTVQDTINFLKSTRSTQAYLETHPHEDLLGEITQELTQALETSGAGDVYTITFNIYLLMAHKPAN